MYIFIISFLQEELIGFKMYDRYLYTMNQLEVLL